MPFHIRVFLTILLVSMGMTLAGVIQVIAMGKDYILYGGMTGLVVCLPAIFLGLIFEIIRP